MRRKSMIGRDESRDSRGKGDIQGVDQGQRIRSEARKSPKVTRQEISYRIESDGVRFG